MNNKANSVPRTAEKLDVSDRQVWKLIKNGDLKSIKIARRTLVTDSQIEQFLTERESA